MKAGRAAATFALCLVPFVLLATLNSAGYRYGASDQAFYIPAVLLKLDPSLFPHDREVLAAQAPLQWADEIVAAAVRITGLDLPAVCALLHVLSLALLAGAAWLLGVALYRSPWPILALLAALTLRHAVPDSGTNTLEGYFHPRQLAFAFGALAAAAFFRRRMTGAVLLLGAAATLHPTTTMWFAIWLGVATFVAERAVRPALIGIAAIAAVAGAWLLMAGPLASRLAVMDPEWIATLGEKDYLFPLRWSWDAWLVNLSYGPAILGIYAMRARARLSSDRERGLVFGSLALLAVFLLALPFNAGRVALAVQLQPGRVFWLLDFFAIVYLVWAIAEGTRTPVRRRVSVTIAALVVASIARGAYLKIAMFPERPLAEVAIPDDDWGRTMAWARQSEPGSAWLASPIHAARYGTSVRLAGHRDVLVEPLKDAALGMYDRSVAMRTRERAEAISGFDELTPGQARALAARYDLDYLVTEQPLDLPVAFESGALRVYRLQSP